MNIKTSQIELVKMTLTIENEKINYKILILKLKLEFWKSWVYLE
jgi:hypothetical protein